MHVYVHMTIPYRTTKYKFRQYMHFVFANISGYTVNALVILLHYTEFCMIPLQAASDSSITINTSP